MLSCKEIAERASALIDGEVSAWEALQIRLHLAMCKGCARFVEQVRATDSLTAQVVDPNTPTAPGSGDARFADILSTLRAKKSRR